MQPGEKSQLVLATDKFGQQLWVYDKDLIGMTILGGEFWDGPLLLPFYDAFSDRGACAIEIGAFFGQGALYLAQRNKYVMAVEPIYSEQMRANLRLNRCDNVDVCAWAAYSHATALQLGEIEVQGQALDALDTTGNLGGVALVPYVSGESSLPVYPAQACDDRISRGPLAAPVSLIKVDAQGCDLRALMGLLETIKRWHPPILFEWEEHLAKLHGDTWSDVLEWFQLLERGGAKYNLQSQVTRGYENCWVAIPEGVEYPNA